MGRFLEGKIKRWHHCHRDLCLLIGSLAAGAAMSGFWVQDQRKREIVGQEPGGSLGAAVEVNLHFGIGGFTGALVFRL